MEKAVINAAQNAITKAITEELVGYNKPLSKLVNSSIDKHSADLAKIIDGEFSALLDSETFKASLKQALNEKLAIPIEINRFRANIIVSGVKAFEERNWKKIIIGECEFKVVSDTVRCSLITINPENGDKDNKQEPLRALAKEFKSNGKVSFGIYLVPTKIGLIKKSDSFIIKTEV